MKYKPIAVRFDTFRKKEILYQCSQCECDFSRLKDDAKYCYGCGVGVDWNVLMKLGKAFEGDSEDEQAFLKMLNEKQYYGDLNSFRYERNAS